MCAKQIYKMRYNNIQALLHNHMLGDGLFFAAPCRRWHRHHEPYNHQSWVVERAFL